MGIRKTQEYYRNACAKRRIEKHRNLMVGSFRNTGIYKLKEFSNQL